MSRLEGIDELLQTSLFHPSQTNVKIWVGPYLGHREALLHQLPAALGGICRKGMHKAQALDALCSPGVGHIMTVAKSLSDASRYVYELSA